MQLLLIYLAGVTLAWISTGAIRKYALAHSIIDIPNSRSSHTTPTPRGGGLAIVVTFFAGMGYLFTKGATSFETTVALMGGGGMVAAVGFWDDHQHIPAQWRLLIHFVAALWGLAWIGGFPMMSLAGTEVDLALFGYVVGSVFLVWLLKLYNFMDGIDGIAGGEALFATLAAILILQTTDVAADGGSELLMLSVLASGCMGFLIWNWPPASIFMGDVGSAFLGFTLGMFALITAHTGSLSIWVWLILLGVFLVDATVTLLRRIYRGGRWCQAHRSHAYQHASQISGSHLKVTSAVLVINYFWLLPLAFFSTVWSGIDALLFLIAIIPLLILAYRLNAGIVD